MSLQTYPERLAFFIKHKGLNRTNFAAKIGTNERNVVNSINGMKSQIDLIMKIGEAYPNLNLNWLLLGAGAMLNDSSGTGEADPTVKAAEVNESAIKYETANVELKYLRNEVATLKQTIKDKEDIIKLLRDSK